MQLDISRILNSPDEELSFSFEGKPARVDDPDTGLKLTGPVVFKGRVRPTGRGGKLILKGQVKAPVQVFCTRCGDPFKRLLDIPVDLLFGPVNAVQEWIPETETEQAIDYPIVDGQLDLDSVVRDAVLLAIPMQMLCRPDCRGCCPHCGAQLNRVDCDCKRKLRLEQSPFSQLKDLFK